MLKKGLFIFCGLLLIAGGYMVYKVNDSLNEMEVDTGNIIISGSNKDYIQIKDKSNQQEKEKSQNHEDDKNYYALIIGMDYREDRLTLNTDSIMVVHFIPQLHSIKLVSLPRDLMVVNQNGESAKINSMFNEGYQYARLESQKNPALLSGKKITLGPYKLPEEYISSGMVVLRETVDHLLDIETDYTFLINFQTVISIVDAVGGIEVDVDRSMNWHDSADGTDIHLDKGLQLLDGQNALNFARFRRDLSGNDSNDFERGIRQQKVVSALVDKIASWNSLHKTFDLIDIISANVKTNMNKSEIITHIRQYYGDIKSKSVVKIPFEGYWEEPYVHITDENLSELKKRFASVDI
jgi:LCP family protein required for cell wall assembly